MSTDLRSQLSQMTADEVRPILQQLLGTAAFPTAGWTVTEIGRRAGTSTAGIFRLTGAATTAVGVSPWSVVVKVLESPRLEGREYDPTGALRELAFYRSGASAIQGDRVTRLGVAQPKWSPHARAFERLPALAQVPVAGRTLPADIVQGLLKLWQNGKLEIAEWRNL